MGNKNSKLGIETTGLQLLFIEAVRKNGITCREISDKANMPYGTVSKMINEEGQGSLQTWQRILDAAGIEIGYRYNINGVINTNV